ncbi:MAG: diacylglycerol kinase family protein [Chloroflexota bacterium]|nr:diacylglycerol kinase family protein [Chloroflexota bacterium]
MMKSKDHWDSFLHAVEGLWFALRTQRWAPICLIAMAVGLGVGWLLGLGYLELALLTLAFLGLFVAELFNTALEATVDLASPGYHPQAKIAKDVSAAAVFTMAITVAVVVAILYIPHLLSWLRA